MTILRCWRSWKIGILLGLFLCVTVPVVAQPVVLGWERNADAEAVTGYQIGWRTSPTGTETVVDVGTETTWTLVSGIPGTTYFFRAYALNASGRSEPSNEVSATIPAAVDTTAPSSPVNLTGVPSTVQVALSWEPATDNIGVVAYRVARGATTLATISGLTFTESSLTPGTSYGYTVTALDAAGNASVPASVTVQTLSVAAACMSNGKPYSITIQVVSYSKQVPIGGRGLVSLTLANAFPVSTIQVKLGAQVVGEISGQELRDITGIGFSVPRTPATHSLFLTATDSLGCVTSTTLARPLVVQ